MCIRLFVSVYSYLSKKFFHPASAKRTVNPNLDQFVLLLIHYTTSHDLFLLYASVACKILSTVRYFYPITSSGNMSE